MPTSGVGLVELYHQNKQTNQLETKTCARSFASRLHAVSMSTSKKARVSSPADEEKKELWDKYGHARCDGLANSLKKDSNKSSGYRHVYPVSKVYRGTYSFYAKVWDIEAGTSK